MASGIQFYNAGDIQLCRTWACYEKSKWWSRMTPEGFRKEVDTEDLMLAEHISSPCPDGLLNAAWDYAVLGY